MPGTLSKNWDHHVADAEEVARGEGFQQIRDRILELAAPASGEIALDVGSGTGLLTLPLARSVELVWALDISPAMTEYLSVRAISAGMDNIHAAVAPASSLPLVEASVDLVVSNYCLHHLDDAGKRRALAEAFRVLRPGGRLVFGDMMFSVGLVRPRDRQVIAGKVKALAAKGPGGLWRLAKNAGRLASGRWEHPASPEWWEQALLDAGFVDVSIQPLAHEGGIASAYKP